MIKSEVQKEEVQEEKIEYPCLMETDDSVSLFTNKNTGIILHRKGSYVKAIGEEFSVSNNSKLKRRVYTGTLELSNSNH